MKTAHMWGVLNGLIGGLLLVIGYIAIYAAIDVRDYIDVRSVYVVDGNVVVERQIHQDFAGAYEVTIRGVPSEQITCSTGRVRIDYKTTGRLPDPMTLAYWAEGGSCTRLLASPLPSGMYAMTTCHIVLHPLWFLPEKKRCVPSNVFTVE